MTRVYRMWIILVYMIIFILSWTSANKQEAFYQCSRYEFHTNDASKYYSWNDSKTKCNEMNGTLISMETVTEWDFIKTMLGDKRFKSSQEWFIGLSCQSKNLSDCKENKTLWRWESGTLLNWKQEDLPWDKPDGSGYCVKVWKDAGYIFDDIKCNSRRQSKGYICEFPNVSCTLSIKTLQTTPSLALKSTKETQSTTNKETTTTTNTPTKEISTTSSRPTEKTTPVTTRHTVATVITSTSPTILINPDASTQRASLQTPSTKKRSTSYRTLSTMSQNPTEKISGDAQIQKEGFPITYLAIALAVLLLLLICILVVMYCKKKKKKDKNKASEEDGIQSPTTDVSDIVKSNSFVAFKMVHNNLTDTKPSDGTYESVSPKNEESSLNRSTSITSPASKEQHGVQMSEVSTGFPSHNEKNTEVVYAAVDKSAKKKANQEPQVTYADLASFNNNHDTVLHMPAPYQPVEYAEIIGKKTSKEK